MDSTGAGRPRCTASVSSVSSVSCPASAFPAPALASFAFDDSTSGDLTSLVGAEDEELWFDPLETEEDNGAKYPPKNAGRTNAGRTETGTRLFGVKAGNKRASCMAARRVIRVGMIQ